MHDHPLCVHTRAGQERGRDLLHWEHGAGVHPGLAGADHTYRDVLVERTRRAAEVHRTAT